VAVFGKVIDDLTRHVRLKHPVFAAIVEVEALLAVRRPPKTFEPLPLFPAVVRDISLVAERGLANQAIVDAIQAEKCPCLEAVRLFDIYEDEKTLGAGRHSLAYSLTYRDRSRTLTDEEVNRAHEKIRAALAKGLPVELR
jgi:phenylalanyl-tRNA synthetase beta chain